MVPLRLSLAEAHRAGMAPPVVLEATHVSALEFASLSDLRAHAWTGERE